MSNVKEIGEYLPYSHPLFLADQYSSTPFFHFSEVPNLRPMKYIQTSVEVGQT